jgi:hypothetical protein
MLPPTQINITPCTQLRDKGWHTRIIWLPIGIALMQMKLLKAVPFVLVTENVARKPRSLMPGMNRHPHVREEDRGKKISGTCVAPVARVK